MCGRDPSARSAGDKRQRREGRLQVGFGQIYAPFLAKIYAQKAFLENAASITWRIYSGVYYTAYIFMDLRSVGDWEVKNARTVDCTRWKSSCPPENICDHRYPEAFDSLQVS